MIVGLMGFEFESPNKGCEALGYSFVSFLSNVYKHHITYYVFTNDGLGLFPEFFKEIEFVRIPLKIKDRSLTTLRAMKKCDYIFDVTLGDSFSDIYSTQQCISNLKFKLMAELFGKAYYLLPQTYGPFLDRKCRIVSRYVINHAKYVFCRDRKSKDYLQKIGVLNNNFLITTDMAFLLPYDKEQYHMNKDAINVGINVSGLLMRGGFTKDNQFDLKFNYNAFICRVIEQFTNGKEIVVHLIPHVIDTDVNSHDDDYKSLIELHEQYSSTVVAPMFDSPIEAKSYIANMDFFVGSRMHSTIAAFSSNVPTVPVSYSRKFEGLFEVFDYPYIVHGKDDPLDTAIQKVITWFNHRDELKDRIVASKRVLDESISAFKDQINLIVNR